MTPNQYIIKKSNIFLLERPEINIRLSYITLNLTQVTVTNINIINNDERDNHLFQHRWEIWKYQRESIDILLLEKNLIFLLRFNIGKMLWKTYSRLMVVY